jgi:guanylate kinase
MIKNDDLLEYNKYLDNYYGTPRKPVEEVLNNGGEIIIEVDVNGAASIREKLPEAVSVFIMPPSFNVLKNRLSGRGTESEELVNKRLNEALNEISRASEYDYIVVNDALSEAVSNLVAIIKSERYRINKKLNIINEVLSKC